MRAGALLILLLTINSWLSVKFARINGLLKQHECRSFRCEADFDGDGEKDLILVDETTPPPHFYTGWLVVTIRGKQELRLPFRQIDGSLRTHVATLKGGRGTKLLVADGMEKGGEGKTLSAVYAWDGNALAPQQPSADDRELLSAMLAFDDAGGSPYWSAFVILKWPAYLFCLLLLSLIIKRLTRTTPLR